MEAVSIFICVQNRLLKRLYWWEIRGALPLSLHTLVKLSAKSLIENLKQLQAPTKEKDYPLFQRESDATI